MVRHYVLVVFFFNDTATTEIYTLSLHDALPICFYAEEGFPDGWRDHHQGGTTGYASRELVASPDTHYTVGDRHAFAWNPSDRKSTRLNSSHANISYAVFCLKKKKKRAHLRPTRN